jgi:hypothetical protein
LLSTVQYLTRETGGRASRASRASCARGKVLVHYLLDGSLYYSAFDLLLSVACELGSHNIEARAFHMSVPTLAGAGPCRAAARAWRLPRGRQAGGWNDRCRRAVLPVGHRSQAHSAADWPPRVRPWSARCACWRPTPRPLGAPPSTLSSPQNQ